MARSEEVGGGDNRSENVPNDFVSLCFYFYSCGVDFVIPSYLERFYKYIFIVVLCVNRLKHSGLTKPEFLRTSGLSANQNPRFHTHV